MDPSLWIKKTETNAAVRCESKTTNKDRIEGSTWLRKTSVVDKWKQNLRKLWSGLEMMFWCLWLKTSLTTLPNRQEKTSQKNKIYDSVDFNILVFSMQSQRLTNLSRKYTIDKIW